MNRSIARAIDHLTFRFFELSKFKRSHHYTNLTQFQEYQARVQALTPDEFFRASDTLPPEDFEVSPPARGYMGRVRDFRFRSRLPGPWPENNVVPGRIYECSGASKGVVVVLHGWLSFSYVWYRSICRSFNRWGMHAAFVELPYHMSRRPEQSAYSGELALSGDLVRNVESFRQAVADSLQLVRFLRSFYQVPVGVWGISLGGWIGSMLCTLPKGPDAAVLVAPVADPREMLRDSRLMSRVRADVRSSGIAAELYELGIERMNPASYAPEIPADRILILRPEEDQAVPDGGVVRLQRAWAGCAYKTYAHGHLSIIGSREMVVDSGQFLRARLADAQSDLTDGSQAVS